MVHFFKKTIAWLGWLVLSLIIVTMLFVLMSSRSGWQFAAVLSGMEPGFKIGGLVVIKPVDVKTLEVGNVISFAIPDMDTPVCHRIIDIQYQNGQQFFQTKGDANKSPDRDLVPATNVKGKEIFYTPYVGRLADVKSVGTTNISVLGMSMPLAVLIVTGIGLLFTVLTLKDTIESILWPGKQWQREAIKKRNEKYARRRKTFYL
jgi:signal peptidase